MRAASEDCPPRGGRKHRAPPWGLMCCGPGANTGERILEMFLVEEGALL